MMTKSKYIGEHISEMQEGYACRVCKKPIGGLFAPWTCWCDDIEDGKLTTPIWLTTTAAWKPRKKLDV